MSFDHCLAVSTRNMLEHPGDFRHDFVAVEIMPGLVLWRLVVNGVELGKPEWN